MRIKNNYIVTLNLSAMTGGRISEEASWYKNWNWDPKIVVVVDK